MSVSVEDKEEEIIITLPKSNDLEIKVYNPHFMESLGWKGVSVSILNENKEQVGGDPSNPSEHPKLTFPYNQFVYMIKGAEPTSPQKTEPSNTLQNDDEAIKTHKRSPGLYGYFSNTLDYLFGIFAKVSSQKETVKEEPPVKTNDDTMKQPTSGDEPSMLSASLDKTMEMKPTEISEVPKEPVLEEPPQTVSKEMEISNTETSEVPKEPVLEEPPQTVSKEMEISNTETSEVPKEPVQEEPTKVETTEITEVPKEPVSEETQEIQQPPQTVSKEMEISKTEPTVLTQPGEIAVPIVPAVSSTATTSPSNLFWKISIPKSSNPPKLFEPSDLGGKYEQHFRDILLLSKMEAKSGIYIVGSFYTIQGKKMKLGTVELASLGKNTLADYLLQVPPLEGTLMDKYKQIYT